MIRVLFSLGLMAGLTCLVLGGDLPKLKELPKRNKNQGIKKQVKELKKEDDFPGLKPLKPRNKVENNKKPNAAQQQGEDPKKIMARVAKNMESSEERLKKKNISEQTQKIQLAIIEDLDKLIQQQQQQNNKGGGSSSGKNKGSNSGQGTKSGKAGKPGQGKTGKGQGQKNGNQPGKSGQGTQGTQKTKGGKQKPGAGKQKPGNIKGSQSGGPKNQGKDTKKKKAGIAKVKGKGEKGEPGKNPGIAQLIKIKKEPDNTVADLFPDVWGMYPEKKRQELDAYSKIRFMPRYERVLREYYDKIAKRSSSKGK